MEDKPSNLHNALAGLNLHVDEQVEESDNTELLVGAATAVVSFVFVNKQAALFNLLIQMLSSNKFTPAVATLDRSDSALGRIPFQPSPDPTSEARGTSKQHPSHMFSILHNAVLAVSQQYQKNFYIHIIANIQTTETDQLLLAGCLSFINHMLSSAPTHFDFERYRQLLSAQGVNDVIKKHRTSGISMGKHVNDRATIEHLVTRLAKLSFPSANGNEDSSITEKIRLLGFETDDATTELVGTGILGLRNLIYFGARYPRIYKEILTVQTNRDKEEAHYSFAHVAMSLTNAIYELYVDDENLYEIVFDQDDWFEELFSISFELFDEIWERDASNPEDFLTVLHKTRNLLTRIKWTNPDTILSFQVNLGGVLDEVWSKDDLTSEQRPVLGLSDSILGLPTSKHHNHTYRFQKFFNERLDRIKTVGRKDSAGSNVSSHSEDQTNTELTSSSSSAVRPPDSPSSAPTTPSLHGHKSHLRNGTKSTSFKKLFEFARSSHGASNEETLAAMNGEVKQVVFGEREATLDDEESSMSTIGHQPTTLSQSIEKMAKKIKKSVHSMRHKDKTPDSAESLGVEMDDQQSRTFTEQQSRTFTDQPQYEHEERHALDTIKSGGIAMYKTVKKAMHSIEKKGKTIKKKVKRRKAINMDGYEGSGEGAGVEEKSEKKKKKKKRTKRPEYVKESDVITINADGGHDVEGDAAIKRTSFQPLELEFETDSLESSEDEEETDEEDETLESDRSEMSNYQPNDGASSLVVVEVAQHKEEKKTEIKAASQQNPRASLTIDPPQPGALKASSSTQDISGEPNRKSIYRMNSFTRGPFGTIDRRKSPTQTPKSASIKNLVNFFEAKQEDIKPLPVQRQKSFKSDS
eukprot:gene13340-15689_t